MYRLAYATYMLMIASAGVTFVFLEDIETDYNLPSWGIGLISALAFAPTLAATLLFAPLGDRGHVGLIGAAGIVLTIVGNSWIGFADELWSISTSRGIVGVGIGMFSVAARKALIGESTEDSGQRIGTLLSAAVAGFIAGPGIGAWLAEGRGIETPYLVIAGLIAVLAGPVIWWLHTTSIATSGHVTTRSMLPLLRRPRVRGAVACQMAIFFNIGVFDSTVDEYLTDLGASNVQIGWILVLIGAPLIVLPTWAGRLVDRSRRPNFILFAATAAFVPIIFSMAIWTVLSVFIALAVIETVTESFIFPAAARVVVDETGAEESAIGQGLLDSFGLLAGAVAAFTAPMLFDLANGPIGSFGMSTAVAAALVVFAFTQLRPSFRPWFEPSSQPV